MDEIRQYVLRLTCGALICALVQILRGPDGQGCRMHQVISSLFLVFLAISPLKNIDFRDWKLPEPQYQLQGEHYAAQGTTQVQTVYSELISEQYVSYILSRAAELSLSPEVSVSLDQESGVPISVTISGEVTPYEKSKLSEDIHQDLGIERSSIHWKP